MSKYAVIKDEVVINLIVADSKDIAEEVTGETCIECDDQPVEIGGTYDGTRFINPKPYPSWVLDEEYKWVAPVSHAANPPGEEPTISYSWNEDTLSWDESPIE
jgi:hypothetical protein